MIYAQQVNGALPVGRVWDLTEVINIEYFKSFLIKIFYSDFLQIYDSLLKNAWLSASSAEILFYGLI